MSFSIIPLPSFKRRSKKLSKKYSSLKQDLQFFAKELLENPMLGTALGNDCYKVRVSIKSKGKGKSGGARVITCVKIVNEHIYLLTIYDKADKENISDKELKDLLKQIK